MAWREYEFTAAALPFGDHYRKSFVFDYKDIKYPWEVEVRNGWLLYSRASHPEAGLLLLGEGEIRKSIDLMKNFGLTSGGGLSDINELKAAQDALDWRKGVATGASPSTGPALDVVGPGSILNDKDWTPLLNDCFILGGVHGAYDFIWAEMGFEQFTNQRELAAKAGPAQSGPQRTTATIKEQWKQYIRAHSNFWAGGQFARVFTRELIGLKTFGYVPSFEKDTLGFRAVGDTAAANFEKYLAGLEAVNFAKNDAAAINAALGEFLFGDRTALTGLNLKT